MVEQAAHDIGNSKGDEPPQGEQQQEPCLRDSLRRIEIEQEDRFDVFHENYRPSKREDDGCDREPPQLFFANIVEYGSPEQKLPLNEAEAHFSTRLLYVL